MRRDPLESVSVWHDPLAEAVVTGPPADAEVCVVGAGIAGITTAYLLQCEGLPVQVIDAYGIGAGETGRTTAHLTAVLDDRLTHLERVFGRERTQLAVRSHQEAIDRIEDLMRDEAIACDFERVDGYLMATGPRQRQLLLDEHEATQWAGFGDVTTLSSFSEPGFAFRDMGLRFPRQATFHADRYLRGLARAFVRRGGRIATGFRAIKVKGGRDARVSLSNGTHLRAGHVVVATNTPFNDRVRMHTKQHAYRTYVVGFEVPPDVYSSFLLWNLDDPYFYARHVRVDQRQLVIVGGADHKVGQENDARIRYGAIEHWSRAHFPALGDVCFRWSGQVMEPVDGLAFIGRNPMDDDNVYIVTGDSGHGLTHGTLAGALIRDLILGHDNPYAGLYDPSRKTLRTAGTYLGENANMVGHMVGDWFRGAEVSDPTEIARGQGAIVHHGITPVAAYRDDVGTLHAVSAVCTHLGCLVQWNGGEKSWDCPCHGSRFAIDGAILNGPARAPLAAVNLADSPPSGDADAPVVRPVETEMQSPGSSPDRGAS
jgi:glycine/D-amino acid oxidase-like deaminating enzyme/nitrite reductase/ring-hydroxylating ferredoxin subunit